MSLARILPVAALVLIDCTRHSAIAQPKPAVAIGILTCGFSAPRLAEGEGAGIAAQVVDVLCSFKLRSGADEAYSGKLLMVVCSVTTMAPIVVGEGPVRRSGAGTRVTSAELCARCQADTGPNPGPDRRSESRNTPSVHGRHNEKR